MHEEKNSSQANITSITELFGEPQSRQDILETIKHSNVLHDWEGIRPDDREKILLFLEGRQGLQILSDKFFRKVFRPDDFPERIESLISEVLGEPVKIYETNVPNIYFIPIGTDVQAPLSLIATPDFDTLVKTLSTSFDLVIIDAPPVGLVIDAAEIAKSCDGSVLVLEYAKTHRRALAEAKQQMERTGTPILGCILNKVTMDRLSTKKYYSYGGKYGYSKYGRYGKYGKYSRYDRGYYRRDEKKEKK